MNKRDGSVSGSGRGEQNQLAGTVSVLALPKMGAERRDLTLDDLDADTRTVAEWVANRYVADDHWPNQVEMVRFCFDRKIAIQPLIHASAHNVFDGSISSTKPSSDHYARVKPWVFVDMGLAADAFKVAHEQYLEAVRRLAKGPETTSLITQGTLPPNVPTSILRLVGHTLVEKHTGNPPDNEGRWSIHLDMNDVKYPLPTLNEFVKRPDYHPRVSDSFNAKKAVRGPKPTSWVFISSTLEDLREHRHEALNAALRLKVLPLGMELWTASSQPPLKACLQALAEADVMILLVGCRYGSQAEGGRSYTEAEYDYAQELQIPVLAFLPVSNYSWPENVRDQQGNQLGEFAAKLKKQKTVSMYRSPEDLGLKIIQALKSHGA